MEPARKGAGLTRGQPEIGSQRADHDGTLHTHSVPGPTKCDLIFLCPDPGQRHARVEGVSRNTVVFCAFVDQSFSLTWTKERKAASIAGIGGSAPARSARSSSSSSCSRRSRLDKRPEQCRSDRIDRDRPWLPAKCHTLRSGPRDREPRRGVVYRVG